MTCDKKHLQTVLIDETGWLVNIMIDRESLWISAYLLLLSHYLSLVSDNGNHD